MPDTGCRTDVRKNGAGSRGSPARVGAKVRGVLCDLAPPLTPSVADDPGAAGRTRTIWRATILQPEWLQHPGTSCHSLDARPDELAGGPTGRSSRPTTSAPPRSIPGSRSTTLNDATAPSAASHPSADCRHQPDGRVQLGLGHEPNERSTSPPSPTTHWSDDQESVFKRLLCGSPWDLIPSAPSGAGAEPRVSARPTIRCS